MALSPLNSNKNRVIETNETLEPSKTYKLDIDKGTLGGFIDDEQAVRQFIRKAIATARYRFLIYDDQYGCELENLIGQDISLELLNTEITRIVTEALIYDDRVHDVTNVEVERKKDELYISFSVQLTEGAVITEEVTI